MCSQELDLPGADSELQLRQWGYPALPWLPPALATASAARFPDAPQYSRESSRAESDRAANITALQPDEPGG